ncbi:MAG: hypothetical protein ACOC0P_07440 [Planctomycetota bacterium]
MMIHIAIIHKRYLDAILDGTKRAELRLTEQARVPFRAISEGERVYLKQASGPFRATAIAGRIDTHEHLTPDGVAALREKYADVVGRGHDDFWHRKRNAKYATIVFLRDVERICFGPEIARSRGLAWFRLPDEADVYPACLAQPLESKGRADCGHDDDRLALAEPAGEPIRVRLGQSNLRYNHLTIPKADLHRLPADAIGGNTRSAAGVPIGLQFPDGTIVESDVVRSRRIIRHRGAWRRFFAEAGARVGDTAILTPRGRRLYDVCLEANPAER